MAIHRCECTTIVEHSRGSNCGCECGNIHTPSGFCAPEDFV